MDRELICPHKKNRVRPATQGGRALRRYRVRNGSLSYALFGNHPFRLLTRTSRVIALSSVMQQLPGI